MMPLLMLAAAAAPAPDDITIIGERIRRFRFSINRDGKSGALICRIKRKSGDPLLDASLCDEAKACVAQNDGKMPDVPAFKACLNVRFEALRQARAAVRESAR